MAAPLYAGIVRVSQMGTRKAGTDSFHADAEQVHAIERYVKALGGRVEILSPELNVSGGAAITERPSLRAAIEGVEEGKYAGVVAAYLSRLTRSRSGFEIWTRVEAAGGTVHAAQESLDTSTPNGRFIRDIHLANAVREREEKQLAFATRREAAVTAGVWMAGRAPRGYDKGPDRRLVPNMAAPLVESCFIARSQGAAVADVARTLGVGANTARHILRNRAYLGELVSGQYVNRAAHPAIVDDATFAACQIPNPRPPRNPNLQTALLAGIIRCAGCGYVMKRGSSGPGGRYRAYACASYRNCTGCEAPSTISATRIDEWIEAEIARPEFARLRAHVSSAHDVTAEREAVSAARTELDAWIVNVPASSPSYAQGLAHREEILNTAEATLTGRLALIPSRVDVDSYDDMTPTERNLWLRGWCSAVLVFRRPVVGKGSPRDLPIGERVRVVRAGDADVASGVLAA